MEVVYQTGVVGKGLILRGGVGRLIFKRGDGKGLYLRGEGWERLIFEREDGKGL